jgi:flagellar protein FliS
MAILNPYNYQKPAQRVVMRTPQTGGLQQNTSKKVQQDSYLEQKVMNAKPEELTMMLYEGLVKFIKMGRLYNEQNNIEKTSETLLKAQAIVVELQATLNMDFEISDQLDSLYDFVYDKLVQGNFEKSDSHLKDALDIAEDLRDTWKEAITLL